MNYAFEHDTDPETITVFDSKEDGLNALKNYENSCVLREGFAGSFYQIEAYALEENEYDDDDELIGGNNIYTAADLK